AGRGRRADPLACGLLRIGRDRVLEVEDQRVGGQRLGLLERAFVRAGHVQNGTARCHARTSLSLWLSGVGLTGWAVRSGWWKSGWWESMRSWPDGGSVAAADGKSRFSVRLNLVRTCCDSAWDVLPWTGPPSRYGTAGTDEP